MSKRRLAPAVRGRSDPARGGLYGLHVADGTQVYVPIEGLNVPEPFPVGCVTFRSAADVVDHLDGDVPASVLGELREMVRARSVTAFAEVPLDEVEQAVELAARAVDVLRVYERHGHDFALHAHFGVASQLRATRVPCVFVGPGLRGVSVVPDSNFTGTTIDHVAFANDELFQWLAGSIGDRAPSEGQRRALVGVEMLSEAIIAPPRPAAAALVTALEAWLKPDRDGALTFTLARSVAFLACGSHNNVQCGRGSDTCPYLALDPTESGVPRKLKRLRQAGTEPPWRCAEWQIAIDWYELRSDVVHGKRPEVDRREMARHVHRVYRRLALPILRWLADHPEDPIGDLDVAIAGLPTPPDWEAILGPMPPNRGT